MLCGMVAGGSPSWLANVAVARWCVTSGDIAGLMKVMPYASAGDRQRVRAAESYDDWCLRCGTVPGNSPSVLGSDGAMMIVPGHRYTVLRRLVLGFCVTLE